MRRFLFFLLGAFVFNTALLAQNRTVTGTITDSVGQPLAGVTVKASNAKIGTTTDARGYFKLSLPQNIRNLEISSVGYQTRVVPIPASGIVNTNLQGDAGSLGEVVVTGITREKKSQFSGAINQIKTKDIVDKPVGSLDQLLQGRVPGVLALTGSGQPGNNSTIIIRGQTSVQGGSTPLYVLDGIPIEPGVFQSLNPNDFASIDILRDAASLAPYGSRGSAGVIVITSKRGTAGKMKLSYNGQFGIKSKPDFAFRPMTTAEVLAAQADYGRVTGDNNNTNIPGWYYSKSNPRYATLSATLQAQADHLLDSISQINTNWTDYEFRQGNFSNHQINLSGGTGKTRIYSSIALYNEQGTTPRTDMQRATLRNNIDYADDKFTFAFTSTLGYTKRNFQETTVTNNLNNPFLAVNVSVPYQLVFKPDGTYNTGTGAKYAATNGLDLTKYDLNYSDQAKVTLGTTLSYKLTPEITASFVAGIDFRETQASNYLSKLPYLRTNAAGASIIAQAGGQFESLERNLISDVRPSINFRKMFASKHDVDVTVYGEYTQQNYKLFSATGYGIDTRTPNTIAVAIPGNASNQLYSTVGGNNDRQGLASGLAIARYTYNGKYTLTGSYRYDGSSELPAATRWQGFASIGGIWEAGREDFIRNASFITTLRLRANYGSAGDANNFPSSYLYQARYAAGSYGPFTTQTTTYPGVPNATWERTNQTNIGIDYGFFHGRLYGDINVYDKRTYDLFVQKTLSAEGGAFSLNVNGGELLNRGVEWNINAEVLRSKDMVLTLFTTGAYNQNKLLDIGGVPPYLSGTSFLQIGLPLGSNYTVKWAGVDAATGQPLYYDVNGKITTTYSTGNQVTGFGTWEAPWKGGFGFDFRYKQFDFSTLFSWEQGAYKTDNLQYFVENPAGFLAFGYNQSADLNFWKKPGDVAAVPSPNYATQFTSELIHDASFVRLRDVTISYSLPQHVTNTIKFISNARLYLQGSNLFIWTHWRGMDPEAGALNINLSEYPNPRAFTGGLDITF